MVPSKAPPLENADLVGSAAEPIGGEVVTGIPQIPRTISAGVDQVDFGQAVIFLVDIESVKRP